MSARRLSEAGLAALSAALGDLGTVNRWRKKVVSVDGSQCWWWTGAISGRGHGRFYFAPGRVIISHRFAFGLVHGAQGAGPGAGARSPLRQPAVSAGPP